MAGIKQYRNMENQFADVENAVYEQSFRLYSWQP